MSNEKQLNLVIGLMCLFNLAGFLLFRSGDSFTNILIIFFVVLGFVILYFFYRRKNWARILMLIGAVLHLTNFAFIFFQHGIFLNTILFLEGLLAVYLLIFLNRPSVKELFRPVLAEGFESQGGSSNGKKALIIALALVVMMFAGGVLWAVQFVKGLYESDFNIFLKDLKTEQVFSITQNGFNAFPRFSSDGKSILYLSSPKEAAEFKHAVKQYSLGTGEEKTLLKSFNSLLRPQWGVQNQSIIYYGDDDGQDDLWIYSLDDGGKRKITDDPQEELSHAVSPDGKWIVFEQLDDNEQSQLYVVSSEGGEKKQITDVNSLLFYPNHPSWTSDSRRIGYFSFTKLIICDLEGSPEAEIALTGLSNFDDLFFHPQDPNMAFFKARAGGFDFNLYALNLRTEELSIAKDAELFQMFFTVSPDMKYLAYSKQDK